MNSYSKPKQSRKARRRALLWRGEALVRAEGVGHRRQRHSQECRAAFPGSARCPGPCACRPCRRRRRSGASACRRVPRRRGGPRWCARPRRTCRYAAGPRGRSRFRTARRASFCPRPRRAFTRSSNLRASSKGQALAAMARSRRVVMFRARPFMQAARGYSASTARHSGRHGFDPFERA